MESKDIRKKFLEFFEKKDHVILPSASLIPKDDPTVLFNVAGMQPLVPYLMGKPHPKGVRLTDAQKCLRTVDIDEVGDNRHCTFFEMMGNWSLGDYFKKEAIAWAYEFLTEELGLDPKRIYVTIFQGNDEVPRDNEALEYWKEVGVPEERIVACDEGENWWPDYGAKGPCGPDTEIFYDIIGADDNVVFDPYEDSDRFMEIWNLVFMEYNCDADGKLTKLEKQNVDTGNSLERFTMLMQGVDTVYETDLFSPLLKELESITGKTYPGFAKREEELTREEMALARKMRIIVEHLRSVSFLIGDGGAPSNEGAGYVIRRLLRRAIYNMRQLSADHVHELVRIVEKIPPIFDGAYPEIVDRMDVIKTTIQLETEKFLETIEKGEKMLIDMIHVVKAKETRRIPGADAFKLYDTFGFPISLTMEIAKEHDVEVDMDEYANELEAQKERSRAGSKDKFQRGRENVQTMLEGVEKTNFRGYEQFEDGAYNLSLDGVKVIKAIALDENEYAIVTNETVFYAESGGQVGDTGTISDGTTSLQVIDTQKYDDVWVHFCSGEGSELEGKEITMQVDADRRRRIMANHTGTHVLYQALKDVAGEHIEQAGAYVDEYRIRLDVTAPQAFTKDQLQQVEEKMNEVIAAWMPVVKQEMNYDDAKAKGAVGLFTEKYGETVRVISVGGNYSVELCGGTHINNTSEIGIAKVAKESSIASGVRRIEVMTGVNVYEYLKELQGVVDATMDEIKANKLEEVADKVKTLKQTIKDQENIVSDLKKKLIGFQLDEFQADITEKNGKKMIKKVLPVSTLDEVKEVAGQLRSKQMADYGLLVSEGGHFVLFSDAEDLSARELFNSIKDTLGGKGGGNDGMVQGVGMDVEKVEGVKI